MRAGAEIEVVWCPWLSFALWLLPLFCLCLCLCALPPPPRPALRPVAARRRSLVIPTPPALVLPILGLLDDVPGISQAHLRAPPTFTSCLVHPDLLVASPPRQSAARHSDHPLPTPSLVATPSHHTHALPRTSVGQGCPHSLVQCVPDNHPGPSEELVVDSSLPFLPPFPPFHFLPLVPCPTCIQAHQLGSAIKAEAYSSPPRFATDGPVTQPCPPLHRSRPHRKHSEPHT